MIIKVSNETREKIDTEFNRFMEDPNNMARLRMKLSYNQRAFLDALKEAASSDTDKLNAKDKLLLFQEAILMFNARPELVPNAPIEVMRKGITFKNKPDDFEELLVMMKIWVNSVKRAKRPINRLAASFARWYTLPLYAAFVLTLSATFTAGLHMAEAIFLGKAIAIVKQLAIIVGAGFISLASGKGIFFKMLAENTTE
ncbi:hypothetical protein [Pseudobutyrivibrio xylanivorans]|uniref:Uncharacterized protein n=1 Tax=Pseudobutyrivibrio xylanivorans TaxID=185007 RepID=A0A1G5S626_PSEXY|nr:hypothetical protein [Pseudobutyrivibrio xylanivorans]SCZ81658.1 hypothetical protein SAMN02910350_02926 [Pseudobutyrivibrio xylanivorans]